MLGKTLALAGAALCVTTSLALAARGTVTQIDTQGATVRMEEREYLVGPIPGIRVGDQVNCTDIEGRSAGASDTTGGRRSGMTGNLGPEAPSGTSGTGAVGRSTVGPSDADRAAGPGRPGMTGNLGPEAPSGTSGTGAVGTSTVGLPESTAGTTVTAMQMTCTKLE